MPHANSTSRTTPGRPLVLLALMLIGAQAASATITPGAISSHAATTNVGRTAGMAAREPGSRSGAHPARRSAVQPARDQAQSRAGREHLVEGNLRDINRRLESRPDGQPAVVRPARCPTCGERARLPDAPKMAEGNQELRGNLHRLQRDVRERKTPHTREHVVEDKLSRPD